MIDEATDTVTAAIAASAKGNGYAITVSARDGDGKAATERFTVKEPARVVGN